MYWHEKWKLLKVKHDMTDPQTDWPMDGIYGQWQTYVGHIHNMFAEAECTRGTITFVHGEIIDWQSEFLEHYQLFTYKHKYTEKICNLSDRKIIWNKAVMVLDFKIGMW